MRAEMAPIAGQDERVPSRPWPLATSLSWACRERSSPCSPWRSAVARPSATPTRSASPTAPSATSLTSRLYSRGGYQLWAGWHSLSAPGTGEAMVEQALKMLGDLWSKQRCLRQSFPRASTSPLADAPLMAPPCLPREPLVAPYLAPSPPSLPVPHSLRAAMHTYRPATSGSSFYTPTCLTRQACQARQTRLRPQNRERP